MSDNQTQYSKEFLQQVEELKKEIGEVLRDDSVVELDKSKLQYYLQEFNHSNTKNLYKLYAEVKYNFGLFYYLKNQFDKSEKCLLKIEKEYDLKLYSSRQYILGNIYVKKGNIEKATEYWQSIQENDDKEQYFLAQFSLGLIFQEQGDMENAKYHWQNIKIKAEEQEINLKKIYGLAQMSLGFICKKQGDIEQAKKHWENIKKQNDIEYPVTQLSLGILYKEQGNIEKAKEYWLNIQEQPDLEQNNQIQNNEYLQKIQKIYLEVYGQAQGCLGILYEEQGDIENAKKHWENIQEKHGIQNYAPAQFFLGSLYLNEGKKEDAKKYWQNIRKEYGLRYYAPARFNLAEIYAEEEDEKQFKECIPYIEKFWCNDAYVLHAIDNIKKAKIHIKNKGKLLVILDNFLNIRSNLLVTIKDMPKNWYERAFAHYTEVTTAINLIQTNNQWDFRLSEVEQCNDPTEGKVLFEFLNNYSNKEKKYNIVIDKSSEWAVFVGCFTFNHDSLNQFRLYGKKQNKEATGVSIVFEPSFFSDSHRIMGDNIINNQQYISQLQNISDIKSILVDNPEILKFIPVSLENNEETNLKEQLDNRLTLYRCIYLDPESFMKNEKGEKVPYLKIATRDELTFYRENDKNIQDFENYQNHIVNIQNKVSQQFQYMIMNIWNLFEYIEKYGNETETLNILSFILLPFSHLVKHSAFHEEQECRIFYCCPFNDMAIMKENFDGDYSSAKLYRKYRAINKDDIARIYLSEGAKGYANVFKRLGIKDVRMSSNPFRTAEKE